MKRLVSFLVGLSFCFNIEAAFIGQKDLNLEISKGNVPSHAGVNKFGRAPSGVQTTMTDIWDRADATPTQQTWTAPTAARVHAIVSTDIDDSDTGGANPQSTGSRTIRVWGLATWGTAESSEDITLDGTTAVNTSASYVIIHRMKVLTAGGSATNEGTLTATAATDGTVTAQINIGEGQTQMAIYGVPSTHTFYLTCYYVSINKAQGAVAAVNINLLVNEDANTDVDLFIVKHTQGVQSTGTGWIRQCYTPYFKIAGPAIIKISGTASAADVEASAGFDGILVTN